MVKRDLERQTEKILHTMLCSLGLILQECYANNLIRILITKKTICTGIRITESKQEGKFLSSEAFRMKPEEINIKLFIYFVICFLIFNSKAPHIVRF